MFSSSPLKRLRQSSWLEAIPDAINVPALSDRPNRTVPIERATVDEIEFALVALARQQGGFDYHTVPHISLGSIGANTDIEAIYAEDHPKIEAALNDLNAVLTATPPKPLKAVQGVRNGKPVDFAKGDSLHEWEVPFTEPAE